MRCSACYRRLATGASCPVHPDGAPAPLPAVALAAAPSIPGLGELRVLGGGGFASVYLARPDEGGAEVAVKVATGIGDQRFAREAAALRHLGPPLVPRLLGAGETGDGMPYLVMERIEGALLADWLAERDDARVPPADALAVLRLLADAVDRMHAAGVLHRDLKPENVFLQGGGHVTLIDFGLARPLDEGGAPIAADTPGLTRADELLGTAIYMAPEQCAGAGDLGRAADLYALGVILFECLTGRPPFVGAQAAVQHAHVARPPPKVSELSDLGPAVDLVLSRALAKDPAARHASAGELARALEQALAAPRSTAAPATEGAAEGTKARAARIPIALLAIRSPAPAGNLTEVVAPEGGIVARVADGLQVVAFPDSPSPAAGVRAALRSAERVSRWGGSCVIHVAPLRVRATKERTTMLGQALDRAEEWARADVIDVPHDGGALLTRDAAATLSRGSVRELGQSGLSTVQSAGRELSVSDPGKLPLIGRDALVAALAGEADRCRTEHIPTLATVLGEPGHGKSRVLDAIADTLGDGWAVMRLYGRHPDSNESSQLLRELLSQALGLSHGADAEAVRAACAERLEEAVARTTWPAVALALGAIGEDHPAIATMAQAPGAVRHSVARAAAGALAHAALEKPLALVVDDAQWADPDVLDALELATMAEVAAPLWVCVAATPQLTAYREAWADRARRKTVHTVTLLDRAAAHALARELLRPAEFVPESTIAALCDACGGVPMVLVETVQLMRVGGAIRRLPGVGSWVVDTDDLLQPSAAPLAERLAARTLAALPPDQLALAQLCAVLGDPFELADVEGVREIAGATAGDIVPSVGLARLAEAGVLSASAPSGFRFRNPILRQGFETLTPPTERRALHDAVRRHLAQDAGRRAAVLARLARHAAACGAREEASAAYLELAEAARTRHQFAEAERLYTAALGQQGEQATASRERALLGRGKMRYRLWRATEARDDFEAAMLLAWERADPHAIAALLLEQATVLDWSYQIAESAAVVERAAALAEGIDDPSLALRLLFARGRTCYRQEHPLEAIDALARAAREAEGLRDYETHALSLLLLAPALVYADRLNEAEQRFAEVIELCERVGDRLHAGAAFINRMTLWMKRHDHERALADALRAMAAAREIGNVALEQGGAYNRSELLGWAGRCDEALELALRAQDLQRFCEHKQPEIPLLCARIRCLRGEWDEAAELARHIAESYPLDQLVPSQQVLYAMVELASSRAASEEDWVRLLARAGQHSVLDERLEVLHACASAAARARWQGVQARCLAEARELAAGSAGWLRRFAQLEPGAAPST